jgi:hypothetical protein
MHFTRKDDGLSIEEYIQFCKSVWKERWKYCLHYSFKDDSRIRWQSFNFCELMALSNEVYEKLVIDQWSHTSVRIKKAPMVYFHLETLYYRFMDVFIKKRSLFLLNLVANKILSMFSWLMDCKFLQIICRE